MKVFFELEAGVFLRSQVRQALKNSKSKLEYWYPGCRVLLTENKDWFESKFYFEADNLPDNKDTEDYMRNWIDKIKSICNG